MARTTKPEEFAAKRKAIIEAAQRLVLAKGYAQISIQDVLNKLQISGGAFHHYFESRGALLDALVERIRDESAKPLLPIVHDPRLTGIQKLQGFLSALDRARLAHRREVVDALRVWYDDGNAIVRQRVDEAVVNQRAPLLTEIVRQGIREGSFSTTFPDQAGEVIMALLQQMGDSHARMLLSAADGSDQQGALDVIVTTHAAFMEAIERVLGAPRNSLYRADPEAARVWVTTLQSEQS
jgi:AcrR family transcriptional regulator